jgi:hypothetical protein
MCVSVFHVHAERECAVYGPYLEDAARKNAMLAEWLQGAISRLKMPWFVPNLRRVEAGIAAARQPQKQGGQS